MIRGWRSWEQTLTGLVSVLFSDGTRLGPSFLKTSRSFHLYSSEDFITV